MLKRILNYLLITSKYPSLFSEIYRRYINKQGGAFYFLSSRQKQAKKYSSVQNSASREEIFPLLKGRGWSVGWEREDVMLWRNKLSKLYAHTSIKVRDRLLMVWFFFSTVGPYRRRTRKHAWILNVSKCLLWYLFMCLFFPLFVLYWEMESRFTSFFNARLGFLKGGGVLLCFWNVHVTIRGKADFL